MARSKYTTIPVRVEVKKILDSLRGDIEWSDFLLGLVEENRRLKRIIAARSIQGRFNEDIEKSILESIESMRMLKLRSRR